jgi:hypothetical protein
MLNEEIEAIHQRFFGYDLGTVDGYRTIDHETPAILVVSDFNW